MISEDKKQLVFPILMFIGMGIMVIYMYMPLITQKAKETAEKIPEPRDINQEQTPNLMEISTTAFENGGKIPKKYTCQGDDVNPKLTIKNVPKGAKSLVLFIEDPDSVIGIWDHWIVYNIDPNVTEIAENNVPEGGVLGSNDFGKGEYGGPCPQTGQHRYYFRLYALDREMKFKPGLNKGEVLNLMFDHVLDKAEWMGTYSMYDDVILTK